MSKKIDPNRRFLQSQPHLPAWRTSLKDRVLMVHPSNGQPYAEAGVHSAYWLQHELYFIIRAEDASGIVKKLVPISSSEGLTVAAVVVPGDAHLVDGFAAVQLHHEGSLLIAEQGKVLRQPLAQRQKIADNASVFWSPAAPILAVVDEKEIGIWRPGMTAIETQHSWDCAGVDRRITGMNALWSPDGQTLLAQRGHMPNISANNIYAASPEELDRYAEEAMTDIAVLQVALLRELLRMETLPRLKLTEWQDDSTYRTWSHLPGRHNDAYLRRLVHIRDGILEEENDEITEAENLRQIQEWMRTQGSL